MRWLQAVVLRVEDPERAQRFLTDALDFSVRELPGGGVELENGAVVLCLEQGSGSRPELKVRCADLHAEQAALLARGDVHALGPVTEAQQRREQRLHADAGLDLMLVQELSEDDRDELPPLPTSLEWDEHADMLVRRILRCVPLSFRDKARVRVTAAAELLAVRAGELAVDPTHALQGLAHATLPFQHGALAEAMTREGVDPALYLPDAPGDER